VSASWGTVDGAASVHVRSGDEDEVRERAAAARRRALGLGATEEALLAAIEAQKAAAAAAAAARVFDPKALKAAAQPTVPRAADAALHQPRGGAVKIFSQKLDLSHVTPRVVLNAVPPSGPKSAVSDPGRPRASAVDVFEGVMMPLSGRRRYDHVAPKVPTASSALDYKPAGGHVALPPRPALPWLTSESTVAPTVPTAASAASHRPRAPTVAIFNSKVDFTSNAAPRAVPADAAKVAAAYVPKGGDVDVFLWKRPPESRREPPPKKSEAQLLEELFPSTGMEAEQLQRQQERAEQEQRAAALVASAQRHALNPPSIFTARRRRGELAM
jgi:hypothetical protein